MVRQRGTLRPWRGRVALLALLALLVGDGGGSGGGVAASPVGSCAPSGTRIGRTVRDLRPTNRPFLLAFHGVDEVYGPACQRFVRDRTENLTVDVRTRHIGVISDDALTVAAQPGLPEFADSTRVVVRWNATTQDLFVRDFPTMTSTFVRLYGVRRYADDEPNKVGIGVIEGRDLLWVWHEHESGNQTLLVLRLPMFGVAFNATRSVRHFPQYVLPHDATAPFAAQFARHELLNLAVVPHRFYRVYPGTDAAPSQQSGRRRRRRRRKRDAADATQLHRPDDDDGSLQYNQLLRYNVVRDGQHYGAHAGYLEETLFIDERDGVIVTKQTEVGFLKNVTHAADGVTFEVYTAPLLIAAWEEFFPERQHLDTVEIVLSMGLPVILFATGIAMWRTYAKERAKASVAYA